MNRQEHFIEADRIKEEILSSYEYSVYKRVMKFQLSLKVFEGNYNDLIKCLKEFYNPSTAISLMRLDKDNLSRSASIENFLSECTRLLHNYTASASSLVDHSRSLNDALYKEGKKIPTYQEEVKRRFVSNPLTCFVKDLRNYMQHEGFPGIASDLSFTQKSTITRLLLDKAELLTFKKWWTAPSKIFILSQDDAIDLLEIVENYHIQIIDFHRWIAFNQREIHGKDFSFIKEKEELRFYHLSF